MKCDHATDDVQGVDAPPPSWCHCPRRVVAFPVLWCRRCGSLRLGDEWVSPWNVILPAPGRWALVRGERHPFTNRAEKQWLIGSVMGLDGPAVELVPIYERVDERDVVVGAVQVSR